MQVALYLFVGLQDGEMCSWLSDECAEFVEKMRKAWWLTENGAVPVFQQTFPIVDRCYDQMPLCFPST